MASLKRSSLPSVCCFLALLRSSSNKTTTRAFLKNSVTLSIRAAYCAWCNGRSVCSHMKCKRAVSSCF